MFRTLRSRLLLSYSLVIATFLLVVAIFLLLLTLVTQRTRVIEPNIRQLTTMSRVTQRALTRWERAGGGEENLRLILQQAADDLEVRILVVNSDYLVVFDSAQSWQNRTMQLEELPARLRQSWSLPPNSYVGRVRAPSGANWLAFSQTVRIQNQPFAIIYTIPEQSPIAVFNNTFLKPLLQAGLAAFLVAVLLAYLIARSVARPLQRLARAAQAITAGDLNQQVEPVGPAEVKRVAESFNAMVQQVKHTQQAQRDFVANVSHDLKTPLTAIQGWSQAFVDGAVTTAEQQQRAATIIHAEAERMTRLVNGLLDLARLESGQMPLAQRPLSLADVVNDVSRSFAPVALSRAVALTAESDAADQLVTLGDGERLTQAVANLIDNALAHTPAGGRVHLSAKREGAELVITVRDSGPGIPEGELERIFERFYQVDKARAGAGRGTGLGLAIARQIVESQGGRLSASSTLGEGSTFTLTLPAAAGDPAEPAAR